MRHFNLFICIILQFSALISISPVNAQDSLKEVKNKLEAINEARVQAALDGDYEALLKFLTDDVIIDPPFEPIIKGKKALRKRDEISRKIGLKYHSVSGTIEDMWIVGDKIYERGVWGMSITTNDLKQPIASYGSYFQIWRKQGDSYLIEYVISNLDYDPYAK